MESQNSLRRITRRYNVSSTGKSPVSISQNEHDSENETEILSSSYSEDVFTNSRVTTSSLKQRKSKNLRHNTSDYSSEENEESSFDKRHSSNRNGNVARSAEDLSNHKPYKLYKEAGEYWNKYPKTDYTYSRYSPHRRELEPGAIIMPNMSRRSIHSEERTLSDSKNNYVLERTHLSRNYYTNSDLPKRRLEEFWGKDEVDYKINETLIQKILRITRITLIYTVLTNYFHSVTSRKLSGRSYIRNYRAEQEWYQKIWTFISSSFAKIGSAYYTLLGSVLLLDSWILRRENRTTLSTEASETTQNLVNQVSEDRWKILRRIGYGSLILLLLLLGWLYLWDNSSYKIQESITSPIIFGLETSISYIKSGSFKVLGIIFWPFTSIYDYAVNTFSFILENYLASPKSQFEYILECTAWPFQLGYEYLTLGFSKIYECLLLPLKFISTSSSSVYENFTNGFTAIISGIASCYEYVKFGSGKVSENIYWLFTTTYQSLGNFLFEGLSSLLSIIYSIPGFLYLPIGYFKNLFASDSIKISEKKIILQDTPKQVLPKKVVTLPPIIQEKYVQKEFDTQQITENIIKELNKKIESSTLTEDDVKRLISNELNLINFKIDQHSKLIENHKNLITTLVAGLDDIKNFQKIEINNYIHAEIQKIYQQTQQEKVVHTKVAIDDDELNAIKFEIKQLKGGLNKLNADKTGMPDFALEPSGGQVISTRCTENYNAKTAVISVFGIPLWYPSNTPRVVINQGVVPGECWAFQGFPGFLVIKLSTRVHIHTFSLEHIPKEISPTGHIDSAPQNFSVWGLVNETERNPLKLGQYTYDANGDSLQYFSVQAEDPIPAFEMIELRIESNHGNIKFTCLYRFRVHGSIANDTPPPP